MRKNWFKKILLAFLSLMVFSCTIGFASWNTSFNAPKRESKDYSNPDVVKPVCYYKNGSTTKYFSSIKTGVEDANKYDSSSNKLTVYVYPGSSGNPTTHTVKSSFTIDKYVTLCLPYSISGSTVSVFNYETGANNTGFADGDADLVNTYLMTNITLDENVTVTVNGTLQIGGCIGGIQGAVESFTSGKYTQITMGNNSRITLSGGICKCYGFVKETSTYHNSHLDLLSSSSMTLPLLIYDYPGSASSTYDAADHAFPFDQYGIANIHSEIKVDYSSRIDADIVIFGTSVGSIKTSAVVISSTGDSLVNIDNSSSFITWKFTPPDYEYSSFSNSQTTRKTVVSGYGDFSIRHIAVKIKYLFSEKTIDTATYDLPISYEYEFHIMSGTAKVGYRTKFLPGAKVYVHSGAKLELNAKTMFFTSNTNGSTALTSLKYPSITTPAKLFVEGNVEINGAFCGKPEIYNNTSTGVIVTGSSFSNSASTTEAKSSTTYNYSFNATISLFNISSPVAMAANKRYTAHGNHWDSAGGNYPVYITNIADSGFDSTKVLNAFIDGTTVSSSITLPTPTYDGGDYSFMGYFLDSQCNESLSAGEHSTDDIMSCLDTTNDRFTIFAKWAYGTIEQAYYCVKSYDGTSSIQTTPWASKIIGESYSGLGTDSRAVNFGNTITIYHFNGWQATVYSDQACTQQVGSAIDIAGDSFTFSSENGISDGQYVVLSSKWNTENKNAPTITVKPANNIGVNSSAEVTATVTNYDEDYFVNPTFESSDTSNLTVSGAVLKTSSGTTAEFKTTATNKNTSGSSTFSVDITFKITMSITVDGATYTKQYSDTKSQNYSKSCFTSETLITMWDGSKKMIKDIKRGDLIKTFNHETGAVEIRPVFLIEKISDDYKKELVTLSFDNGNKLDIVGYHAIFIDEYLNYVNIDSNNFSDFVGLTAVFENNGILEKTRIVDAICEDYYGDAYTICASETFNVFTNDILTVTPNELWMPLFEIQDDYTFDSEEIQHDIDTYGLFTYEELSAIVKQYLGEDAFSEEILQYMFYATNAKYFKIGIGKGIYTFESLMDYMMNDQSNYLDHDS